MPIENVPEELTCLVTPKQVRSYARAKGWQRDEKVDGGIALFAHPAHEDEQLIVPMDASFDDYSRRIADVVFNLAGIEKRPAIQVLNDLLNTDADILRFQVSSLDAQSGSVPLQAGIRLLEGARRSLLAAACSAIAPVTYHPRMSRTEAVQLLDACRLGQTERGSFTAAIVCPLRAVEQEQSGSAGSEPFARRATGLLMDSANRLVRAIEADQVESVYEAHGDEPVISANLCDAILLMQPPEDRSSLVLSASWASILPPPADKKHASTVKFQHDYFPIVEDIYAKLRPSKEPTASLFVGQVDTLNGSAGDDGRMQGETTLSIMHEQEVVKTRADLQPDDYQTAIEAHRVAGPVKFKGVLHLGRRIHRITSVAEFEKMDQ